MFDKIEKKSCFDNQVKGQDWGHRGQARSSMTFCYLYDTEVKTPSKIYQPFKRFIVMMSLWGTRAPKGLTDPDRF